MGEPQPEDYAERCKGTAEALVFLYRRIEAGPAGYSYIPFSEVVDATQTRLDRSCIWGCRFSRRARLPWVDVARAR